MNCRFCNHPLSIVFIDLGETPPSNSFLSKDDLNKPEYLFPLKLFVCDKCFLVQVDEFKRASEIFSEEYIYFSSYSTSWLAHAKRYSEMMIQRFHFDEQSQVIEIASNDGYLLQYFNEKNIPVLGVEPTLGTAKAARAKGIETLTEFFGTDLSKKLSDQNRKADLLLGNNVLAHVPDINDFVSGMKMILKPNGVITMEFPHLVKLIAENQFDTIYHEHFSYLSFTTVKNIFNHHGLDLFDVEELPTHGGSLRIFAKHSEDKTKAIEKNVSVLLEEENQLGVTNLNYYIGFQQRAEKIRTELLAFLLKAKSEEKKICAYGAAAKGNTLLNYCNIKSNLISFVVDASPYKQGKYLPGSHIPVLNESELKKFHPDFIVILPWNIQDEIIRQLNYVRSWNSKFVLAIPSLKIL